MRGALTGGLPDSVEVCGEPVSVDTDWRVWVDVWRLMDDVASDSSKRAIAVLALAYPRSGESPTPFELAAQNPNAALEAALAFLERKQAGQPKRPETKSQRRNKGKRLFDWDWDAERIVSDFEREYSIDLTDPELHMHWWRFMALFNGLSDKSQTMNAISTRAADLGDKRLGKEERRILRERKLAYMLPARTKEEAAANRAIRGV